MANVTKPANRDGFSIAIICAIREERDAVMAMLDKTWDAPEYGKNRGDDNIHMEWGVLDGTRLLL